MEITDRQAQDLVKHLWQVRTDILARLDEYTLWVNQLKGEVNDDTNKHVLRHMGSADFAENALERLEAVTHIHTGSTDHMHFRQARRAVIRAGHGED